MCSQSFSPKYGVSHYWLSKYVMSPVQKKLAWTLFLFGSHFMCFLILVYGFETDSTAPNIERKREKDNERGYFRSLQCLESYSLESYGICYPSLCIPALWEVPSWYSHLPRKLAPGPILLSQKSRYPMLDNISEKCIVKRLPTVWLNIKEIYSWKTTKIYMALKSRAKMV